MHPLQLSATDLVAAVHRGDLTATECTEAFLASTEAANASLNAFLAIDREGALTRAADIDARRKAGKPLGALAGLPVGVKDALCTADLPTTCASKMLAGYRPPYDAEVVARLRRADAVIIGKTNMDEFAMGGSNENSAFGPVRNPWDVTRAPGGSSGGSAACVAADMAPVAIDRTRGGPLRRGPRRGSGPRHRRGIRRVQGGRRLLTACHDRSRHHLRALHHRHPRSALRAWACLARCR
jgi:aspartyl-tRNA(Asn)/glutamyl-tRNA(Gln) amidotransferase subunit A